MGSESSVPPRKRGGCVWFVVLLCVAGVVAYVVYHRMPQSPAGGAGPSGAPGAGGPGAGRPARAVPVVVATAKRGDLPIYRGAPGTVVALNTVTVRTRVDGEILKVSFKEGQMVKEGDLLVQIDPRPFEVQLTQAEGQLARDQAALKNAQLDVARYKAAGKAATQQQLDAAEAAVAESEGNIKTDQGQIDSAKLQLVYCRITAPVSGKIGLRLVDVGNVVHASDANGLAVITQIEPITATFSLAQDFLQQILKAESAGEKLPVDVFDVDKSDLLASGTLLAIDSQIDLVTLTAKFKAIFKNKDHALFPNQAINARMLVETKKDTVLVPAAAIQRSPQTAFVYVVKPDNTVEMRPITPGPVEGNDASVEQGLSPDEIVVTQGVDKLEPGAAVSMPQEEQKQ